jgi:putative flavoprotein involved in K+ transport
MANSAARTRFRRGDPDLSGPIDAVVVGAGQSGLAASWHLSRRGIEHVVLERGRVGQAWRQRWDSFALNSPSSMNRLPGEPEEVAARDGFLARDAWIDHLQAYADGHALPIRTSTTVTSVSTHRRAATLTVTTTRDGGREADTIETRHVIVASGAQAVPKVPALSSALPSWVHQLHTADYRAPAALPSGAVLVVGSAQSGVQVVEDLLDAGRTVYLCTNSVPRLRRRQRGRDSLEWLREVGYYDVTPEQLPDPRMMSTRQPLISGVGPLGHTVSLQSLAERGARLLGRPVGVEGGRITLDDSLGANIEMGDRIAAELNGVIERGIVAAGLAAPPMEPDPADEPHPDPMSVHSPDALDLEAGGVSTVIWATGFDGDFGFLPASVIDGDGLPIHDRGAALIPGIHFMGLRWMTTRKSALILGADSDAADLAERIARAG